LIDEAEIRDQFAIKKPIIYWLPILLILFLCGLFIHLQKLELSAEEPRRATVALEMIESGEYIVPHLYGIPYYNKPPLHNWLIAGTMQISNSRAEWTVRLPGILSYLLTGLLLFLAMRRFIDERVAIWSAVLYWFSADLLFYASIFSGELDLFFSLLIFANALCIFNIGNSPNKLIWWLLAYILLAAAVMTKSWIALHFHFFALIGWMLLRKSFKSFFSLAHLIGLCLFVVLLSAYFVTYNSEGNLKMLLLNSLVEAGSKVSEDGNGLWTNMLKRWISFPLTFLKITLPASLLLLLLLKNKSSALLKKNAFLAFSFLFVVVNIWPYWFFIELHDRYLYAFVPFVVVICVHIWSESRHFKKLRRFVIASLYIMAIGRILYNLFVMPALQDGELSQSYMYRDVCNQISEITSGQEVNLLYKAKEFPLPEYFFKDTGVERQPYIPYQIPYYLQRNTGKCPKLVSTTQSGQYYLIDQIELSKYKHLDSLFSFEEQWHGSTMVLCKHP
jgi:4-amino-4-deoxy-L-arabinose transferase-like glycosyltransferase